MLRSLVRFRLYVLLKLLANRVVSLIDQIGMIGVGKDYCVIVQQMGFPKIGSCRLDRVGSVVWRLTLL